MARRPRPRRLTRTVTDTEGLVDMRNIHLTLGTGTPPVVPPPVVPSTTFYGSALNADGIGNLVVGSSNNEMVSQRFTVGRSGTVVALRTWLKNGAGYGAGDGGDLKFSVQADVAGVPSGISLGHGMAYPGAVDQNGVNAGRFLEWSFTVQPTLVAGTTYHIVWENLSANPAADYASVNCMYMSTVLNPRQPVVAWDDMFVCLRKAAITGNVWVGAWGWSHYPQLDLRFADGTHWGQGYMNTSLAYGVDYVLSGTAKMVRERFTVTGDSRVVTGAAVRIAKTYGSGPLTVRLENNAGVLIDSFTVASTNVPVQAPNNNMTTAGIWVSGAFSVPRTLLPGTEYRLRLSTDTSTELWTRGLQKGDGYGFDPSLFFDDGVAEITTNGTTWAYTALNVSGDLQFYFTTTEAPLWSADFESGVYGDYLDATASWNWVGSPAPAVTSAQKYTGTYSAKFTILPGQPRCEGIPLGRPDDGNDIPGCRFTEGDDLWFSLATRTENFENTSNWQMGGIQWKNDGFGSPPIALTCNSGQYELTGGWGYPGDYNQEPPGNPATTFAMNLSTPVVNNTWIRWVFHIKFSKNPAIGTVDVWRNGTQVLTSYKPSGGTLYPTTIESYMKLGYYRSTNITSTGSIYLDDVKVGPTAASVGGTG